MVSILDRTLIIDLCIRFIHNYYWFKRETNKIPRKTLSFTLSCLKATIYNKEKA